MTAQTGMYCRYCGEPIVWREGHGWLVQTTDLGLGLYGSEQCSKRPTGEGGPESGHRLPEPATREEVEVANGHLLDCLIYDPWAPERLRVVGTCSCHNPDGNGVGRMDWRGTTVEDVVELWLHHVQTLGRLVRLPLDPEPYEVNSFELGAMRFATSDGYPGYRHDFKPRPQFNQNREDYPT